MDSITTFCKALFPGYCVLCSVPEGIICPSCYRKLIRSLPHCPICGKLSSGFRLHQSCLSNESINISNSYSCWQINRTGEEILRKINNDLLFRVLHFLTDRCADDLKNNSFSSNLNACAIVALPTTKREYLEKGFSSSEIVAKRLAEKLELRYMKKIDNERGRILVVNDLMDYKRTARFSLKHGSATKEILTLSLFNQIHKIGDMHPVKA